MSEKCGGDSITLRAANGERLTIDPLCIENVESSLCGARVWYSTRYTGGVALVRETPSQIATMILDVFRKSSATDDKQPPATEAPLNRYTVTLHVGYTEAYGGSWHTYEAKVDVMAKDGSEAFWTASGDYKRILPTGSIVGLVSVERAQ